jgi:ATP-dependent DNA helicase RecG
MSVDVDRLLAILTAERHDGCRDRIVIGGLGKLAETWLRQQSANAAQDAHTPEATRVLRGLLRYAAKSPAERSLLLDTATKRLQSTPTRTRAPSPRVRAARTPAASDSVLEPDLSSPITAIRGMRTANARCLRRRGVKTIRDLLYYFPHRYDDYTHLKTTAELQYGEEVTLVGVVEEAQNVSTRRGHRLTKAVLSDSSGFVEATWFNQPYLLRQLTRGRRIVISGRVDQYMGRLSFPSPQWEPWHDELVHTGRLAPVYPLTEGLTARAMRSLMKPFVSQWAPAIPDCLPADVRQRLQLVDVSAAVSQMHFPADEESLSRARHRLCFEEFLLIQLGVMQQRQEWRKQAGRALRAEPSVIRAWGSALPFVLTTAQERVLGEIIDDVQQPYPMSRLLQGDVGSGKTVVALLSMLVAIANGLQAVIMAPTEVLADQHHRTLTTILDGMRARMADSPDAAAECVSRARVGLLRGSQTTSEKEQIRGQIASGQLNVIVGTHALLEEGVTFHDLGLAVVDEQHRFGVAQRASLRQKGYNPHILVMSATPIPRTLALTIYGDLDLSIIDQLPPHRQIILTRWLQPSERQSAYDFVRQEVECGRQAFIICPLIEESDKIEAKAAVNEYLRLQEQVFPDLKLGLLHGRMSSADKEDTMARFRGGEYQVLVTTPVVEVGIDVPNATVMLVESADHFGLAQLHQFRGRVGRGEHQSHCLLLAEEPTAVGKQRLKIIETTNDGFLLAEEDLRMRGPGEFFGTRQSGLPDLKVAQIGDVRFLEEARSTAQDIFQRDPSLSLPEHGLLAIRVHEFWAASTDLS